jgi:hypothetical protein
VKQQPLWKLQTVGRDENVKLDFLYDNVGRGDVVTLRPGVVFCFRRFHGLIEDLVRGAWVRFLRGITENRAHFGDLANLDEFLFGPKRESLDKYRKLLVEVQKDTCFYCARRLNAASDVDHFVPWSRYPSDLGHNFVLAHSTCNRSKGDSLAAKRHLERWLHRNDEHGGWLSREFAGIDVVADVDASRRVAAWAYGQVEATGGLVWNSGRDLVPLDPSWRRLFVTAV